MLRKAEKELSLAFASKDAVCFPCKRRVSPDRWGDIWNILGLACLDFRSDHSQPHVKAICPAEGTRHGIKQKAMTSDLTKP